MASLGDLTACCHAMGRKLYLFFFILRLCAVSLREREGLSMQSRVREVRVCIAVTAKSPHVHRREADSFWQAQRHCQHQSSPVHVRHPRDKRTVCMQSILGV